MLRRTGFARKVYTPSPPAPLKPATRLGVYADCGEMAKPVAKENPLQHQAYMRLVRQLPCARCGRPGPSQFCHTDESKGTGIKSDCRRGWPGCAECHRLVGTVRIYPRTERRALEDSYSADTRRQILAAGQWPKNLPLWTDQPKETT